MSEALAPLVFLPQHGDLPKTDFLFPYIQCTSLIQECDADVVEGLAAQVVDPP